MKIQIPRSLRQYLHYIALAVLSIGLLWQIWSTFDTQKPLLADFKANFISPYGNDFISTYNKKFDIVRPYLKPNSLIGYFSEPGENYVYWGMHMCLTQYNVAPAAILDKQERDTILYNLYNTQHINPATDRHLQRGWKVLKDFDNGLILLVKAQ